MQGTIAAGDIGAVFSAAPPLEMHALDLQHGRELGSDAELRFFDWWTFREHTLSHCAIARKVLIRLLEEAQGRR